MGWSFYLNFKGCVLLMNGLPYICIICNIENTKWIISSFNMYELWSAFGTYQRWQKAKNKPLELYWMGGQHSKLNLGTWKSHTKECKCAPTSKDLKKIVVFLLLLLDILLFSRYCMYLDICTQYLQPSLNQCLPTC